MIRAASARIDITPPIGADLQGYAGRFKGSEGILDPLQARCVVFEDESGKRWALIAADVISFENTEAEEARRIAADSLGGDQVAVSLATTHTHSGPALLRLRNFGEANPLYVKYVVDAIGNLVKDAVRRLQPATVMSTSGTVDLAVNRRKPGTDGRIALSPYPEGAVDHEVTVTVISSVDSENARPIAVLTNYACHPVTLGANYLISADFPGVYARAVEAAFPGAVALFLNGASGDINPPAMDGIRTTEACGLSLAGETIKQVGRSFADRRRTSVASELVWAEDRLTLPLGELPPREELTKLIDEYEGRLKELGNSSQGESRGVRALREWAHGCLEELEGGKLVPHRNEAIVQTVSIGETAFAFIPGELFVELGAEIKRNSPFQYTHIVGYSNGWVGYLPTVDAVKRGGYEPTAYRYWQSRPLAPESGYLVVREATALLEECRRSTGAGTDARRNLG